ncbi:hypothetical protein [Streptomyces sp. 4N124]|uniref:hypothetical protein n=1 Tax=Streptomyces sp. 4N124 TaxID=3457420 RepID=UPI003FD1965D
MAVTAILTTAFLVGWITAVSSASNSVAVLLITWITRPHFPAAEPDVVALTSNDIRQHPEGNRLILDRQPVPLPPPLDAHVEQLATEHDKKTDPRPTPTWLFRGSYLGWPMPVSTLQRRLNSHGVRAKPSRVTACLNLAQDLPPAVLASIHRHARDHGGAVAPTAGTRLGRLSGRPAPGEKRTLRMALPASCSGSTLCLDEAIAIQERACLLDVSQHR